MAAVSAPHALTPPSSSHGSNTWNYSVPVQAENLSQKKMDDYSRPTNGHALGHQSSRPNLSKRTDTFGSVQSAESGGYLAPARINALNRIDSSVSDSGSAPDSLLDLYSDRKNMNGAAYKNEEEDPDRSRWIHRDKLARIESQELQAAGITLPQARATSKSGRRETSRDQQGNGLRSEQAGQKRQRMESFPSEEEEKPESNGWDLRTPQEAAEDQDLGEMYQDISGGVKGISRIPVWKTSPIPIPFQHLERDTPMLRKKGGSSGEEDAAISNPKSRGRSGSDKIGTPTPAKRNASENSASPTKKAAKKGTTPATRAASNQQRPKTRAGTITRETSAAQRPPTRTGEVKRPEGDPPWLASMYKPDPRLPPDQQLLPTVAKRLQQEQWEKDGKFGNAYDTSFRPLNDEQFHLQPDAPQPEMEHQEKEDADTEWPLRSPKSPTSPTTSSGRPGTSGGYSTLPKITPGTSQGVVLPSPKPAPIRVQEPPEEAKKGGCGCCVVM